MSSGFPWKTFIFYGGKGLNIIRDIITDYENLIKINIQYFSSKMILDIIQARQIIKSDYIKVKNFQI